MFFTEWNERLVKALNEPFPPASHKKKKQGGQEITFVDVHQYKERLNATVGPHGWSCTVRLDAFGGKLVCTTALTVLGVTKENVGDEVEVPEKNDRGNEKIIGAPVTNSYAQAFKRACSDFGLGAYLYVEEKRNEATKPRQMTPPNAAAALRKVSAYAGPDVQAEVEDRIKEGLNVEQARALLEELKATLATTGATA